MALGGVVLGDNEKFNMFEDEEKKAEVRVEWRTSRTEAIFNSGWMARRGCVRNVVA